jgi:PTS system nitrogen regulatory IIA component
VADLGFLEEAVVETALDGADGPSVIAALLKRLTAAVPELEPQQTLLQTALVDREELASTALGLGFAVPHCKIPGLDRIVGVYGRTPEPVAWGERDGVPVRGFFLIVSPLEASGLHIRVLAVLARLVRDEATREILLNAGSAAAIVEAIQRLDAPGPA